MPGFLDGVLDFISPGVGTALGAVSGFLGQSQTNATNTANAQAGQAFSAAQADKQMEFQERMSSTAYQRATRDMQAAGLNPMLAYSQGGSSTPSGAMGTPQIPQIGNKGAAAAVGAATAAQTASVQSQIKNTDADTLVKLASVPKIEADTRLSGSSAGHFDHLVKRIVRELHPDVDLPYATAREKHAGADLAWKREGYTDYELRHILPTQARLMGLQVPRASNEAAAEGSWWKKNVSPYLPDVLKSSGSAAGFSRAFKAW